MNIIAVEHGLSLTAPFTKHKVFTTIAMYSHIHMETLTAMDIIMERLTCPFPGRGGRCSIKGEFVSLNARLTQDDGAHQKTHAATIEPKFEC